MRVDAVWQRRSGGMQRAHRFVDGQSCNYARMAGSTWVPVDALAPSGVPYGELCTRCVTVQKASDKQRKDGEP